MIDFKDYQSVVANLPAVQTVEHDNRQAARESDHFLNKSNGQWEPDVFRKSNGKPRYQFDLCTPVVDQIVGPMEESDFSIVVRPSGGEASKEDAETYNGLIRNLENLSGARDIYNAAARQMVSTSIAGWRVVHDWVDGDSFDQDLLIKPINNFRDRVWYDPNAELPDMSDAKYCYVMQSMSKDAYDEEFPEGSGQSVGDDRQTDVYTFKKDEVVVGELVYREPTTQELVLMSNGAVYVDDEKFKSVADELSARGVTETRRRKRDTFKVFTRLFDGGGWLSEPQETVFSLLPVIPIYANFSISENKVIYWSAVEKLMDSQRVYNYAKSRQIEEGALAPRAKMWLTREQASADIDSLATLNTNTKPVQFWKFKEGEPPPFQIGGAQINPGLQQTAADAGADVQNISGVHPAQLGNNPGIQSGVALELQQNKGDVATLKYFNALQRGIQATARVLVDAIPKTYDAKRQVRLLGIDGTEEVVVLNDVVVDEQTGKPVSLNDLSKGQYDVTVDVGEAFHNRQQKTVKAITEIAAVDPTILQTGSDIMLRNISAPGMDLLADRKRMQMVDAGLIPPDQMTEEEVAAQQEAQDTQGQQPDALLIAAQAEVEKANAQRIKADADAQDKLRASQIKAEQILLEHERATTKQEVESGKLEIQIQKMQIDQLNKDKEFALKEAKLLQDQMKLNQDIESARVNDLNTSADTLGKIRDAMGNEVTIVGPHNTEAYIGQATDLQEQITGEPLTVSDESER